MVQTTRVREGVHLFGLQHRLLLRSFHLLLCLFDSFLQLPGPETHAETQVQSAISDVLSLSHTHNGQDVQGLASGRGPQATGCTQRRTKEGAHTRE